MTNPNYTHMLAIVDRSGSMRGVADDMIGGLNSVFAEQAKVDGDCFVDYVQFDDSVEVVFEDKAVAKAKAVLQPRGMTALLDAVGVSVTRLGDKLAGMAEDKRPGTVMVFIVTDGHENSSREWNYDSVKALVEKQTNEFNWDFTFLGANIDAPTVGAAFGVARGKSITYDVQNTGATMASLNTYSTNVRSAALAGASVESVAYSDEDRQKAVKKA